MSIEHKQNDWERRLEQATAADLSTDLDPESSAWRDGWLAFGKLLDDGNKEDQVPKRQLLEILNTKDISKPIPLSTHIRNAWKRYASVGAATLAVSFLLAIGMLKLSPDIAPPDDELPAANYFPWNDAGLDFRMMVIDERLTVAGYNSASLDNSFDSFELQLDDFTREVEHTSM
jgi:hypothetical protein